MSDYSKFVSSLAGYIGLPLCEGSLRTLNSDGTKKKITIDLSNLTGVLVKSFKKSTMKKGEEPLAQSVIYYVNEVKSGEHFISSYLDMVVHPSAKQLIILPYTGTDALDANDKLPVLSCFFTISEPSQGVKVVEE